MAFKNKLSITEEMDRLKKLAETDRESAANMVKNGKLLVEYAQKGQVRAISYAIENMDEENVSLYYSVNMFRVACANGKFDVMRFMLQHGFDLTESCMRDILHTVIESIDSAESSDRAQALIRFLLENGVDVNWQREKDWYTALHVACCRNLYAIAYLLLIYSADPNAIAQNDDMPLICAERVNPTIPYEQEQNDQLIQILKDHHARRTWRRSSSVSIEKDIHNNKQKEVYKSKAIEPVEKLNTSFQKILRFSDSCNLGITFDTCNDSASTDSHDTGTATLTAA